MLRAIDMISRRAGPGSEAFRADEAAQVWAVHHFEILGEAARGVSTVLREAHPEVPWGAVIAMRNVVIHRYFEIDVDRVWGAIERDLPGMRADLERIAAELGGNGPGPAQ